VVSDLAQTLPIDPLDHGPSARQNVLRTLAVFRRRGWVPVVVTAAVTGALAVVSLLRPPDYEATGMVQLGMYSSAGLEPRSPAADALFDTHHRLLTSNAVVDAALAKLGVQLVDGPGRAEQREQFLKTITITPITNTFLIQVDARAADAAQAARTVNALMDAFIPFSDEFLGEHDTLRRRQLREEEQAVLAKLRDAEQRQRALYAAAGGMTDFDSQRAAPLAREQQLQERLTALQLERAQADAERDELARRVQLVERTDAVERLAGLAGDDPLVSPRREKIATIDVRLAGLSAQVPADRLEGLPEWRALKAELAAARRELRALLGDAARQGLAAAEARVKTLAAQEEQLRRLVDAQTDEVSRLNHLEGQFRAIGREVEWHERELEQTRSELRRLASRNIGGTGAVIIDRAEVPAQPRHRLGATLLLAAAIGSFFMGLMLIIIWDQLDDAIIRQDDLVGVGAPVLGQVPHLDLSRLDELTHLRGSSWAAEALGLIRTNIAVAAGGLRHQALLVTSAGPGEGKSFFTLNLATALARAGGRTLLIEADLRRPRIRPLLVLDERPEGLSDVLLGEATLDAVIRDTEFEGLDVLPSGPCPINPPDVLLRPSLEELLKRALQVYDHVVLDGPPARPLADASLLARQVHGVIHVARAGVSRRGALRAALEQIEAVGGRNLGVVLDDVTPEDEPAFQYAGYGPEVPARGQPVPGGFFVVLPTLDDAEDDAPARRNGDAVA
jgi:capsular exopolysaccharide synthesis family protein